jgi:hypothetical protein
MKLKLLGVVMAASVAASCDTSQPPIGCPVQSLEWAATYKPKGTSNCAPKAGEQLGVQKFSTPTGDERLSIKPQTLVDLDARDTESSRLPYSLGAMPKEANGEGFCVLDTLAVAEQRAPADPANELQARDVSYKWSNVRVLAKPEAPGTQMVADLEYTENGCTAEYEVWAMWPGDVSCATEDGRPDDSICANAGSINPDFAVMCDPTQLLCVPAKRPPSFK